MNRILLFGLIAAVAISALAEDSTNLGLSSSDLDRLGVILQEPRVVSEFEIASGPAEVAVPPAQEAIVTSTVGGVLSRVLVAEGDFVSEGQPLAVILSAELLVLQREYIEAALATDLARMQLERDRSLYLDGIIAQRRTQESAAAERAASATLDQIGQQLVLAGLSQSELARLLESHELNSTLTLKAPFTAFVIEQRSALGARVDAMDPVYHVADLSPLWLEMHVPQEKSNDIKPGMRVIASTADRNIEGEVLNVARVADAASQTILVRARIENETLSLRVGQFLPARILDVEIEGNTALAVPNSAVVRVDGTAYIFGGRENSISALPIEIFAEDGINTYIRSDLGPEISIAVAGIASLKSVWVSVLDEGE